MSEFDPSSVFDRALFGLTPDEVAGLGPVLPHLCEVAWEALERSGVRFDRLRTMRVGTYLGVSDPQWVTVRDAAILADLLGLPGPATTVIEDGAGPLLAVHLAAEAVRAGDLELALIVGDPGTGAAAVVLGMPDEENGRVRGLILGSAVNRTVEDVSARTIAAARAGVDEKSLTSLSAPGVAGLVEAIAALERGELRPMLVSEVGETSAAQLVVGVAEDTAPSDHPPRILGLSARSAPALRALVRGTLDRIRTETDLHGLANDALARPGFEHRIAAPIRTLEEARERLGAWLEGESGRVTSGYAIEAPVAFVIPPAGAQYVGMGDVLYGTEPVFREALNRCDRALRAVLPRPLLSVLYPSAGREVPVDDPVFANPLTFSLAFALAELYRSRGLVPGAVLGCGVGELAAAAIAGAVDVEDAVRVSAERGRLLVSLASEAGRAVIGATEAAVRPLLREVADVDIVALPMPNRVVIGGSVAGTALVVERAHALGLRTERMTGHPNNTPLVDPILGEFSAAAAALQFQTPEIAWVSAATGRRTEHADTAHWSATLRSPMRFSQAVETLYSLGCRSFVELAARPTLLPAGERTLADEPSWWFSALEPEIGDRVHLEEVLSALWVLGAPIERGPGGRFPGAAELPTYPWDRRELDEDDEVRFVAELSRVRPDHYEGQWLPELGELPESAGLEAVATLVPLDEREQSPDTIETVLPAEPRDLLDIVHPGQSTPMSPPVEAAGRRREAMTSGWQPAVAEPTAPPVVAETTEDPQVAEQPQIAQRPQVAEATVAERPQIVDPPAVADLPQPASLPQQAENAERAEPAEPESQNAELAVPAEPPTHGVPDAADVDDLGNADRDETSEEDPLPEEVTLDDMAGPIEPGMVIDEPTEEIAPDPTSGLLDEQLEDMEVEAYAGREPRTLAEAEQAADAEVMWEERWVVDELPETESGEPATWIILADAGGVGDYLATLLESAGHRIIRVLAEEEYPRDDGTLFLPDPTGPGAWEAVVDAVGTVIGTVRLLHLWALDVIESDSPPSASLQSFAGAPTLTPTPGGSARLDALTGWAGVVALVRELQSQNVPLRIHLVTRGAVRATDVATAQTGGSLWGLAGALACESPFLFGGIVDLDPDDEDPDALLRHLLAGGTDARPVALGSNRIRSEHVFRNGQRWRRSVERVHVLPTSRPIETDGAWVIAGDVDIAALELAQWFASQGVTRIFLVSHQAPVPEVLRGVLELQRKAVGCIVVRADPTDAKDVAQIRTRMSRESKICGVVLRVASQPRPLAELDLAEAMPGWRRALAMAEIVAQLARDTYRWVWSEGRSLDGVAGGGLPAIAGAAVASRIQSDTARGGVSTIVHTGPSTDLSPGQSVRLLARLGPTGGVHGVWRER